jgi:hypothetical protein
MKRLIFLMVAGALVVSGCGSAPEKKINVELMKSDPPMGCQMVGDVQAKGDDMNEAKNELRLKAEEQGGNYVRLDALDMSGGDAIAAGAAFNCQRSGSAEAIESPPKSKSE